MFVLNSYHADENEPIINPSGLRTITVSKHISTRPSVALVAGTSHFNAVEGVKKS